MRRDLFFAPPVCFREMITKSKRTVSESYIFCCKKTASPFIGGAVFYVHAPLRENNFTIVKIFSRNLLTFGFYDCKMEL